ncbi:hypothetical protein [Streptomyces gibsoniae]|uniref:Uncharacterized protein n=1 Tax=Streptomyces gibsoniae TaxID=3075529 RepID=A0ABU2U8N5_9ACTN|nr:hypothetical protein [Streptomyces sp. DSM 41699]MDT0469595.1 hypothetical protein [Streptomyces sp. DSM 41699]
MAQRAGSHTVKDPVDGCVCSRSRDWWRLANHSVASGAEEGMQR